MLLVSGTTNGSEEEVM